MRAVLWAVEHAQLLAVLIVAWTVLALIAVAIAGSGARLADRIEGHGG
jgi:hypothetical protein